MIKYPNPKFFRMKDQMDLSLQKENIKEIVGIVGDILKETDWKKLGGDVLRDVKATAKRLKKEVDLAVNMDKDDWKEFFKNGEKQLGKLYQSGKMATVRREWRGVKDTAADFYEWLRMWAMLLATFGKDLVL